MPAVDRHPVLLAVGPQARHRLQRILGGDCDLRHVASTTELLQALDPAVHDMVVVGAHFDESHTLDVLARIFHHDHARIVVCVCGRRGLLGEATVNGLGLASRVLGARGFVDLTAYPDDDAGDARIRSLFQRLLGPA